MIINGQKFHYLTVPKLSVYLKGVTSKNNGILIVQFAFILFGQKIGISKLKVR